MPASSASAPGKVILFGEHAVVYGRPAIAAPVTQVQAKAIVRAEPRAPSGRVRIQAPGIGLEADLQDLPPGHPLAAAIQAVLAACRVPRLPACTIRITSTIPVAAGLGSGAAVTVALARALSAFIGCPLETGQVSALAFEIEKLHHGTPSGIDNSVIAYCSPVYFVRDQALEVLSVPNPFTLVIGDTGIASPTAVAVGDLRRAWQADPEPYEALFDAAGQIARSARQAIESGQTEALGPLMDRNQELLARMGVSAPELDVLIAAARDAGAQGAKLSGGGRGGNMLALVSPQTAQRVAQVLRDAGACRTLITEIRSA